MLEIKSSYHYLNMEDLGNKCPSCELSFFGLNLHFNLWAKPPNPPKPFLGFKSLLESTPFRPLQVGDDVLGHPNGVVPTLFLLPNLVSNHLAIGLLFYHIGGAIACHTLKFSNFRMWLKLKIKQQFSHNFKIFSTFIFLHKEFSVKENKYWLFFKLNEVFLRVMHSCHMHSVVKCDQKFFPGIFRIFLDSFPIFPRANSNF